MSTFKVVSIFSRIEQENSGMKTVTACNYGFAMLGIACPYCKKKCDCTTTEREMILAVAEAKGLIVCPFCCCEFEVQLSENSIGG